MTLSRTILSAIVKNIGALAITLPIAFQIARLQPRLIVRQRHDPARLIVGNPVPDAIW